MIPPDGQDIGLLDGFPRVSGDDPERCRRRLGVGMFSPRERG